MVRNYVRRDVDRVSESHIKLPELESKLVVHSSKRVTEEKHKKIQVEGKVSNKERRREIMLETVW